MRVLYGAFAQGQGHFSKAAVLIPLLESRGHEVRLISSGGQQPPDGYHFGWHRHFPGLAYVVSEGRIDYKKSFLKWLSETPRLFSHLWTIRELVREFRPDVVLSDFEPLSASPFIQPNCEVIALSRQVALSDRSIPLPQNMLWERKMTRSVVRFFTAGADRLFGYHYEPASFRCVPPIIREELRGLIPENGSHILVYNYYDTLETGSAESLIAWADRNCRSVIAYGFPDVERGRSGRVMFRPPSRTDMIEDMRTAGAVITSAGLTAPLEAFLLRKPTVVVPIPSQWEQQVNAFQLQNAGLAARSETWNYDFLLDQAAPSADHPLLRWLQSPVERVLDHVLDGRLGAAPPRTEDGQSRPAA